MCFGRKLARIWSLRMHFHELCEGRKETRKKKQSIKAINAINERKGEWRTQNACILKQNKAQYMYY